LTSDFQYKKLHPDPVMGRGYLNVRATGGAVEPLPWSGLRGLGRRSKPSWQEGWVIENSDYASRNEIKN